jgi:cyclic pyranopterin phosphate synthase
MGDHGHDDHGHHDAHDHHDGPDHADDCHHAADVDAVGVGVLTISSTRSLAEDESGSAIVDLLEAESHQVAARELVTDDLSAIRQTVRDLLADPAVEAVVTTGGTGVSPDDVTIPAVRPLFDRELDGIGERFRALSAEDVGPRGLLSRATAGVADGVPVVCLPGSRAAVELGVSELVRPLLPHLVGLAGGGETEPETLTHVDASGEADMVDVGGKDETPRRAVAAGRLDLRPATVEAVREDEIGKGDVLATVRLGAIDAVKHTWETIPLCHQIPVSTVETAVDLGTSSLELEVAVETVARTGPEMEALQGVTTGLNVAWDMVKSAEKDDDGQYPGTRIADVRVVEKRVER